MCGISGIYNLNGAPVDRMILQTMSDLLFHRGPDDAGLFTQGSVGLAHRRLSIIDLSERGRQPMSSSDGRFWIIYNGEVYNYLELMDDLRKMGHKFHSKSDTEVIIKAYNEWGTTCVDRFNGMFAFAIWDARERRVFCARDRLGVKPFYYYYRPNEVFVFASEIKAILSHPAVRTAPDARAIYEYLEHSFPLEEKTWFEGIQELPPGHCLTLHDGRLKVWCYWDVAPGASERLGEIEAAEVLRDLLSDSVRLRMRSDVPLGCHLSGGIDSSAIVALVARQMDSPINTFSGRFIEGSAFDESRYAELVVNRYRTEHHSICITAEDFRHTLPKLVWHMDQPVAGPALVPQFLVSQLASRHVKVVLGGQGGDELFGGYHKYMQLLGRQVVAQILSGRARVGEALNIILNICGFIWAERSRLIDKVRRRRFENRNGPCFPGMTAEFSRRAGMVPVPTDAIGPNGLTEAFYFDLKNHLRALLQVEDRTSMAVSLESRLPLLDYRIVEFAFSLSATLKMKNGIPKYILRRSLRGLVPDPILKRRDKRGFPTPTAIWFRGPLRAWVEELLLNSLVRRGIFEPRFIREVLMDHESGRGNHAHLIWKMLNIELWHHFFIDRNTKRGMGVA